MKSDRYAYDIDDIPPIRHALLYGLQWAFIVFPTFVIVTILVGNALHMEPEKEIRFLQLTLLTSGLSTVIQTLRGHRYPLLDGPATALLLTFLTLAPSGISTIQAGTMVGGALLILLVVVGKLKKVVEYATPNVIGVILMLVAFTLLPYLMRSMAGMDAGHPHGDPRIFFYSFVLVIVIAAFSHWLPGSWKTVSLLIGMLLGTLVFAFLGLVKWGGIVSSTWFSIPAVWTKIQPAIDFPVVLAFASSYFAVVVNSLGSLHGIARITDSERLPSAISRGIFLNGVGGVCCGLLGLVGTVTYSMSPGVILANRVASRYAVCYCGIILVSAAFVPKLEAFLSLIPAPVVGAALCSAMGVQVGAGLSIISAAGPTVRDYFVVGLPILLGTLVGFLPPELLASTPATLHVFLGNGLVMGIFLVLLLDHIILRKK